VSDWDYKQIHSFGELEGSRHFRNKKKGYLKAKFEELETNCKTKDVGDLSRGSSDLKKGYQPRTDTVKDEKGDLFVDPTVFLVR
jgi:hypothetical protein